MLYHFFVRLECITESLCLRFPKQLISSEKLTHEKCLGQSPLSRGFPGGSKGKASACNAGDPGFIPGLGSSPGEGHGNPLQYSCLENPMDRGAWRAIVQVAAAVSTPLSMFGDLSPLPWTPTPSASALGWVQGPCLVGSPRVQ